MMTSRLLESFTTGCLALLSTVSLLGAIIMLLGLLGDPDEAEDVPEDASWLDRMPLSSKLVVVGALLWVIPIAVSNVVRFHP